MQCCVPCQFLVVDSLLSRSSDSLIVKVKSFRRTTLAAKCLRYAKLFQAFACFGWSTRDTGMNDSLLTPWHWHVQFLLSLFAKFVADKSDCQIVQGNHFDVRLAFWQQNPRRAIRCRISLTIQSGGKPWVIIIRFDVMAFNEELEQSSFLSNYESVNSEPRMESSFRNNL